MGHTIPVYFMPIECLVSVDNLWSFADTIPFLPDYDEWQKSPEKFGLRTSASRNWWHQFALSQICKGLGINGLEFVLSEHFVCLKYEELENVENALTKVTSIISNKIPGLGVYECSDVEFLRLPENSKAFERAILSFDVESNDSAESFYSFIKSFTEVVKEARSRKNYLLYMRPLP